MTICAHAENAYVFTVLNKRAMLNSVEQQGFQVLATHARRISMQAANLGKFRLHDFVLRR